MLLELKNRAIEADQVHSEILDRCCEWDNIVERSDDLVKFLDLDIGEESKTLIRRLIDTNLALNLTHAELEAKRDKSVLEYALAKLGGNLGSIIDYVDNKGRKRTIVVEDAQLLAGDVAVTGTRLLQSGKIGKLEGYVCLDSCQWQLR
ncbi:hypothetical protein [Colwellia psychrerythraea]|uniref:Uncharacterized protein n=1 Tax=Colwellia psychrerythraea TaxID=28229 RepID=A0A099L6Z6_COLPS|nr:hypothetical protein [Colwellia psychrerythraea]KGJ97638.1 hypothetical protein GAB14E_1227 [Colwellia psychrerythraea]